MLEFLKKNALVDKNKNEEETLIILYDMGYDTGAYSHMGVIY